MGWRRRLPDPRPLLMPSYMIRGLPAGLIQRAKARARDREDRLDAILIAALEAYAEGQTAAQQLAASGGHARAASLSDQERRDSAQRAAQARWGTEP